MLGRSLHILPCNVLHNSTHSSSCPSFSIWHAPTQRHPLRPPLWLPAVPFLWSLVIFRTSNTFINYIGGSLGSGLLLGWPKRKRIAKAVNRDYESDLPTTATAQIPAPWRGYHAIQGIWREPYRNPSIVCEPFGRSKIYTIDGARVQPLRGPQNHVFTFRPVSAVFFSTVATTLGMGLRDHGSANCLVVAPRRTIVSNEKVVTRFRGQRRRKRISQSCIGSGLETRTSSILGNFNHSSERWSTALAWIQDLRSNPELWDSKQHSWLTSLLLKHNRGLGDKEDSLESWIGNTRGHKVRTWENKLIPALRESPLDVLKILRANLESSRIFLPGSVVEDCLDHLAYFNLNRSTCTSSPYFDMIYSIVGDYLEAYSPILYPISLSQRTIRLISTHCDADQLILFLEKLEKYTAFIHTNTKLHIMPKLVEYGKVGLALSMLKDMPAEDLLLENVQMFCTMLLRAKLGVNDPYRLRSNLLAFMLEAGVRPNRLLANIIILNAAEAGDLSTAWRSHAIAKENGLVPDAGTYTALLKGVHHRNAKLTVRIVYRDAKLDGWLFKSSRLKFELLVAFYISNNGKYNNKPYSDLLPYYQQFFDVKPLYELGILHSTKDCIEENDELPEPEVQTLGLILLAWLTENHGSGLVLAVYERYRYYIQHNHYLIAQLAETDHTANAFIMAFGQSPRTVHRCTQVVQDMLKAQVVRTDALRSSPSTSDVPSTPDISHSNKDGLENVIDDSGREHISNGDLDHHEIRCIAPPSVQTWSIMLFAFIKNGQSSAAEKVLALMEARGQKPNTVTWNSLLSGYAYWQNFPGIIHTLDRMDQAGFGNDEWTTKALARVVDRDALLRSLEESTKVDIDDANGKQAMAFS